MPADKITRAELFERLRSENARIDPQILREPFNGSTDTELAEFYGLNVLEPGVFSS